MFKNYQLSIIDNLLLRSNLLVVTYLCANNLDVNNWGMVMLTGFESIVAHANTTVGVVGEDADLVDFTGIVSFLYNSGYTISGTLQADKLKTRCIVSVAFDAWRGIEFACKSNGLHFDKAHKALIPLPSWIFSDFSLLNEWNNSCKTHKQIFIIDCRFQKFNPVISGLMRTMMLCENTVFMFLLWESDIKTPAIAKELDYVLNIGRGKNNMVTYDEVVIPQSKRIPNVENVSYEFRLQA